MTNIDSPNIIDNYSIDYLFNKSPVAILIHNNQFNNNLMIVLNFIEIYGILSFPASPHHYFLVPCFQVGHP